MLLLRSGPRVMLSEYNATTGDPTPVVPAVMKRLWPALSEVVFDSQQQRVHFFTRSPRAGLSMYSFDFDDRTGLGDSVMRPVWSTDGEGLRLRHASSSSSNTSSNTTVYNETHTGWSVVTNLWNVAPWESRGNLLAVAPGIDSVFRTSVLVVNTSSGLVSVLGEVQGSPILGLYTMDSKRDRYFFVVTQARHRFLVVYYVEEERHELVGLGSEMTDLAGLHYDRGGCRLIALRAREYGVVEALVVGFPATGGGGDATLTHLSTIASTSGETHDPYRYFGHTALLRVGADVHVVSREPNADHLDAHNLEQRTRIPVNCDLQRYDIVGMAVRTRRTPTVSGLEPARIGIWGQSEGVVHGYDFGVRDPSPKLMIGRTVATSTSWISDSSIRFKAPKLPALISDPWQKANGYIYRTSWEGLTGTYENRSDSGVGAQRDDVNVCHPSYPAGTVCAYAGTPQEMRCTDLLSIGFVCARWDTGRETVSLDVQLGVDGSWATSQLTTDVVSTWFSVQPTTTTVDGGQVLTISGGPFNPDDGAFECRFGGQTVVTAYFHNASAVWCKTPRWPLKTGSIPIELFQGGSAIPSDSNAQVLFVPGNVAQIVLLNGPTEVGSGDLSAAFELELRDQDGNPVTSYDANITAHIETLSLVQTSAQTLTNRIQGSTTQQTRNARSAFSFSIERAGSYAIKFASDACGRSLPTDSNACVRINATLEVLLGTPIQSIIVTSAPGHALAGLPVPTEPEIRVLDSENRVSNVAVQVTVRMLNATSFSSSNVTTVGGVARFTDLIIFPAGRHTIIFSLSGAHSDIEAQHSIQILVSEPKRLFNNGSRPFGTHPSMLPLNPPPSVWVVDVAGNRIVSRYWTQLQNGTLVPHNLNVYITAQLSTASAVPGAIPSGVLYGAVTVLLDGQPDDAGQCSASGCVIPTNGACSSAAAGRTCQCEMGWQGAQCTLPSQNRLCGGGDDCSSDLGYWNATTQKCVCLDPTSMQYSVKQNGGGRADFTELFIDAQGKGYFITFTSHGLLSTESLLFAVSPGVGSRLYTLSHPQWAAAGAGLSNSPIVVLKDAGHNVVPGPYVGGGLNISCSLVDAPEAAKLAGSLVRKIYDGRAKFPGLIINKPSNGSPYRLKFSAVDLPSIIPAYTHPFEVEEGPPAVLEVVQQPDAASGGRPFRLQPKLRILDPAANLVSRAQGTVVAHLQNGGPLRGNKQVQVNDGLAEYTDLSIDRNASNYTILFTSSLQGLNVSGDVEVQRWYREATLSTTSHPFEVMAGRAVDMVIFRQPGEAYGGEIVPQPILQFVDKGGNLVPRDRMVISVLARQPQQADVFLGSYQTETGSIEFTDLQLLHPGTKFQLVFAINASASFQWAGSETIVVSDVFKNQYGPLTNLSIEVQPDNVASGWHFSRSIKLVLMDRSGNRVPKTGVQVNVRIDTSEAVLTYSAFNSSLSPDGSSDLQCRDTPVAVVEGTSPVSTWEGVAYFTDLRVGKAGEGFRLVFESTLLESAMSQRFGVTLGEVAVALHVACSPGIEMAGMPFRQQPILEVVDQGLNRMHNQMTQPIEARLISHLPTSASMTGLRIASLHGDLATFTNLAIDLADEGFVIEFYAPGLESARSLPFEVVAGPAVALHVQRPFSQPNPSEPFPVFIASRDRGGNHNSSSASRVFNVKAKLLRVESMTRSSACRGSHQCLTSIDLSVPAGSKLLSANLSISTSCTDFDSSLEQVTGVMIGLYALKQTSEYNPGPFEGCSRDCSKSAHIVENYDIVHHVCLDGGGLEQDVCRRLPLLAEPDFEQITRWDLIDYVEQLTSAGEITSVELKINVSPDVNFSPCNGHLLDAEAKVVLTYTVPEEESILMGNHSAVSQDGVARFDLMINMMQRDYVLSFMDDSNLLLPAYTPLFRLSHGPVRQLIMLSEPAGGTGNTTLEPAPVLMLADAADNRVDMTGELVEAHLIVRDGNRPHAAQLGGRTTVASKDGLVHFTDLFVGIKSDGFNYTILFSLVHGDVEHSCDGYLSVCSTPFHVVEGPPCCMRIVTQPRTTTGGSLFSPQPSLKSYDWGGNHISLSQAQVHAKIGSNGGITGQVSGSPAIFLNGTAYFLDLAIYKAGFNYTIVFTSPKMISVTSLSFSILVGEASGLKVKRQIAIARIDKIFVTQPSVAAVDAGGNIVKDFWANVMVSIHTTGNPFHPAIPVNHSATLTGTTTGYTYEGVSYFWNLRIDQMGQNFRLRFFSDGLNDGISEPFDVFGNNATRLAIVSSPSVYTNMLPNPDIVVAALDEAGNVDGFVQRSFLFSLLPPIENSLRLLNPVALKFSKGLLTIEGIKLSGMAVQARWRVEEKRGHLSVVSEPFDMIDPLTGWWAIADRREAAKLFVHTNVDSSQVQARRDNLTHDVRDVRQPNLYSSYGSFVGHDDRCIETSLWMAASQSSADVLGYHLKTCEVGLLQGIVALKVETGNAFDASWVRDIVHLEILEHEPVFRVQKFIVVANSKNSSSSSADVMVYRWGGNEFQLYQRLSHAMGAHDIEHFVYGGLNYIIVANHFDDDGLGYGVPSTLYQYSWSKSQGRNIFQPVQAISSEGSVAWKFLDIEGQQYLATANYFNGSHYAIDSRIYRIQRTNPDSFMPRISFLQSVPTIGARDVVHISAGGKHFLAFASRYENSVPVMEWSSEDQRFHAAAPIPCAQAVDLEIFESQGASYVVCMSLTNIQLESGATPANGSAVFQYESASRTFRRIQRLPTQAGKYMSIFASEEEVLLSIANVKLSGADSVPPHLLGAHAGKTDVFSWDGNKFVPYLNLPTRQGYANLVLELPCSGNSIDGLPCAHRTRERLLMVAQGEGNGMQIIALDSFNGTREATHLVLQPSQPAATQVNATIQMLVARVMNLDEPSTISWIQETVTADSLKWLDPVLGITKVGKSAPVHGVSQVIVNASGYAVFSDCVIIAAGQVSMRVSNMYLNPVRMSQTPTFSVDPGSPAKLDMYSAGPLALISGDVLSAIVIVCDVFGNHQPVLSSQVVIQAFSNGTSGLSLTNRTTATRDGVARFAIAVIGNTMNGVIRFDAENLEPAYTPPFDVKAPGAIVPVASSQILVSATVFSSGNELIFFGGRNGTTPSNAFISADTSTLPYQFSAMSYAGELPAARYGHVAVGDVVVNFEKAAIIIGGTNGINVLNDVHKFDLASRTWTNLDIPLAGGGRYAHRAQLAKVNYVDSGVTSVKRILVILGGKDSSGASVGRVELLMLLSRDITHAQVGEDVGNPFTNGVIGCCNFMFKWFAARGYVFGRDSTDRGMLYLLEMQYDVADNVFNAIWSTSSADSSSSLMLPQVALTSSAFELAGRLFLVAAQSTAAESAAIYSLDVTSSIPKWLAVEQEAFSLPSASMYSVCMVATGKALLVPMAFSDFGSSPSRRLLTDHLNAFILSVVRAEQLSVSTSVPRQVLSGVALSPGPMVYITDSHGNRARDQSGDALVTVTAYDSDTMEPVRLMGQQTQSSKDGIATFQDIAFAKIARLSLKFSSPSLPIATWGPINVVTGPGAYVVFALQPYGAQQGKLFSIQPIVKLSDATGNDVSTDSTTLVFLSLEEKVGTLFQDASHYLTGTTIGAVRNGTFTFTDLGLAYSAPFDVSFRLNVLASKMITGVTEGFHLTLPSETRLHLDWSADSEVCTQLSLVGNRSSCKRYKELAAHRRVLIAGLPLRTHPRLTVTLNYTQTKYDTAAIFNMSLVWAANHSAVNNAMAAVSAQAVAGQVSFPDVRVNTVPHPRQAYKFKVESPGFPVLYSEAFDVVPGVPSAMHVWFNPQASFPSTTALADQPVIYVVDAHGNAVDVVTRVTASAQHSSSSVPLLGNMVAYTSRGIAIYTDLALGLAFGGYTMSFVADDICCGTQLNVTSTPFAISVGDPYRLEEERAPGGGLGGKPFVVQPAVRIVDAGGNFVTAHSSIVVTAVLEKDRSMLYGAVLEKMAAVGRAVGSMEHFEVNGTDYIMVAINYDPQLDTYHLESVLYYWDPSSEALEEVQRIMTDGATFCKHVQYGSQHYVFIANGYREIELVGDEMVGTYLTDSDLYWFTAGRLQKVESFATQAPTSIESFAVGGFQYVVVGNSYDGISIQVKSDVYRFTPDASANVSSLTLIQELDTQDVSVLYTVYERGQIFMVVGTKFNMTTASYVCRSRIFRWRAGLLIEWQTFPTYGVIGVVSFESNGKNTFLAVANSVNKRGSKSGDGFIAIHHFKDLVVQETAAQEIGQISDVSGIAHFSWNGTEHLVVTSNPANGERASLRMYKWDATICSAVSSCFPNFTFSEELPIDKAESLVFFRTANGAGYLVYGSASGFQGVAFRASSQMLGTVTAAASHGVASFVNLGIKAAQADYRFRFESDGLLSTLSSAFTVLPGPAVALSFLTKARSARGGKPFFVQPQIGLCDEGGNVNTTESGLIVSAFLKPLQNQTLAAQLRGNREALVRNGVAAFTDLGIDLVGSYMLQFNCSLCNLKHALQEIAVTSGSPHGLGVLQSADLALGGLPFGKQPILSLVDPGANVLNEKDLKQGNVSIRVAASISGESGTRLLPISLPDDVLAAMVASPSFDAAFTTIDGEARLVMAMNEDQCAVYQFGCKGPSVVQTFEASHVVDLEFLRADQHLWLLVASHDPGHLRIFWWSQAQEQFILKDQIPLQGLSSVKGMILGDTPYILASGIVEYEDSWVASNFSRLYMLGVDYEAQSVTQLTPVQNVSSSSRVLDAEHFRHHYRDYLLILDDEHLILHIWNSMTGRFEAVDSVAFAGEDVEVICCPPAGELPMIAVASLTHPSVLTVLQGTQPDNIGLRAFQNAMNVQANTIPATVLADNVRHIWRGTVLYLCLTNEDSVRVYRVGTWEETLLGTQAIEMSLPQPMDAIATRMQQAVMWVQDGGETYLLLTGRDDDVALLQLGGSGALSGTTVVSVMQGVAQFTDLAVDLSGMYELSFRALSLDAQHESYDAYVAAGQTMHITVAVGQPSQLALSYAAKEGLYPAVIIQDQGGNRLGADAVDDLQIMVMATKDVPSKYSSLNLKASYPMSYPAHVHHFAVGTSHFVAVANSFDGVKYAIDSQVMRLTEDGNLVGVQTLATKCAYRFSSFEVTVYNVASTPAGSVETSITVDHYLAVANHFDDTSDIITYATSSVLYKMNPTTETFVVFQEFPTLGATKLQHFNIRGVQFVAIANFFDGTFHSVDSQIWKWDANASQFSWHQNVATLGAHDVEHLSADGQHFLVIAQYRSADEVGYASSSLLLQYREGTERFELISQVQSAGARDIEVFEIAGVSFFAVANYASPGDGAKDTQSLIYKLECSEGAGRVAGVDASTSMHSSYHALPLQAFDTVGASSWTHFERGGLHYLALTNLDSEEENALKIYAWNGTGFYLYHNLTTDGDAVVASDFFTAGGLFYGIISLPDESMVQLYQFVSDSGAAPSRLGPAQVGSSVPGQALFDQVYSLGHAFDFHTLPEGELDGASSGPVVTP